MVLALLLFTTETFMDSSLCIFSGGVMSEQVDLSSVPSKQDRFAVLLSLNV